ncbi:hypothetical protein Moror_13271 [Moniliophthora roreri MCA 2997]|uniref:Uncharacterized protein n=1 Tax=Moniliophthora roreri (strain MCA 2997) TaxID=1381753 RepID=V2YB35_MONRO|nr:hypothetical protein Moror_13271 [Moniliophthora roreri MCA 2997]
MASSPSPLHPTSVSVLLQYIAPPSQLTDPLPNHLISQSLLQRHFFLDLRDPSTDPASYLSWPSEDQQKIFSILESLPTPIDHHSSISSIRYSGDEESAFAHAEITTTGPKQDTSDGIRLIFQWDDRDSSWRYHNVALMPFPTHSFDSPSSLPLVQKQTNPDNSTSMPAEHGGSPLITVDSHHNDEDSYWDAYGGEDDERLNAGLSRSNSTDPTSEDAYWAQYSSVHGSADSARPSPPPTAKRKLGHFVDSAETETDYLHDQNDFYGREQETMIMNGQHTEEMTGGNVLEIPYQSFNIKRPYDRQSPPSPHDLSERLRGLSESSPSESTDHHDIDSFEGLKEAVEPPIESDSGMLFAPTHVNGRDHLSNGIADSANGGMKSGSDAALREAIRGTYLLWKLSASGVNADKGMFLDVVKTAISDC